MIIPNMLISIESCTGIAPIQERMLEVIINAIAIAKVAKFNPLFFIIFLFGFFICDLNVF